MSLRLGEHHAGENSHMDNLRLRCQRVPLERHCGLLGRPDETDDESLLAGSDLLCG